MPGGFRRGAGAVALAVLGVACSRSVDTADLQRRLAANLQDELNVAYVVTCPAQIDAATGTVVRCTAAGRDGTVLTLRITQTDDHASVTYDIVEG